MYQLLFCSLEPIHVLTVISGKYLFNRSDIIYDPYASAAGILLTAEAAVENQDLSAIVHHKFRPRVCATRGKKALEEREGGKSQSLSLSA